MTTPKKPFWLRPRYTVVPLVALVAAIACFVLAFKVHGAPSVPGETPYMLGVVGLAFLVLPVLSLYFRYRAWKKWEYLTYRNVAIMLDLGGYKARRAAVLAEVVEALDAWKGLHGDRKINEVVEQGVIWVRFEEKPINLNGRGVEGYTDFSTRTVVVGYNAGKPPSVHETALQHEVGHIVLGGLTGSYNEEYHHSIAESHGFR